MGIFHSGVYDSHSFKNVEAKFPSVCFAVHFSLDTQLKYNDACTDESYALVRHDKKNSLQ